MEKIIGLKELRQNMPAFTKKIKRGDSFIVIKQSKPIFRISPIDDDGGRWETVVDFTKIKKSGISLKEARHALARVPETA